MFISRALFLGCVGVTAGALTACYHGDHFVGPTVEVTSSYSKYPSAGTFSTNIPRAQVANLEYRHYMDSVASHLSSQGFTRVSSKDSSMYKLSISYNVEDRGQALGNTDWYTSYIKIKDLEDGTSDNYVASVQMMLTSGGPGNVVFKSAAVSTSSSPFFAAVGGCLIDKMFEKFPVPSGRVEAYKMHCDD